MAKLKPRKKSHAPRRLTQKQLAFVHWYCSAEINFNATAAARRAGYKGNDKTLSAVGAENLAKPGIALLVSERTKAALSGADITVEKVLRDLEVTRAQALQDKQYNAAARCSEHQGKYLKMFTDRIEHVQTIEDVSTEALVDVMRELAGVAGIDLAGIFKSNGAKGGALPDSPGDTPTH